MIVVLIVGILVTAALAAGAILGFPLPQNVAFWALAALTLLLTIAVAVSHRRKDKMLSIKSEKSDTEKERDEIAQKLAKTEDELAEHKRLSELDNETATKFITLLSMLLRVSPADADTLLRRAIKFFTSETETRGANEAAFMTETFITDALAPALSSNAAAHMNIVINIPESFPAKLSGSLTAARSIITETAEAVISLPPKELLIDIDFKVIGDIYGVRFIFEAVGIPLSKAEIDILTGGISRGGAGAALYSAKARTEALNGKFEIKQRGSNTLFSVMIPFLNKGAGIIGGRAAKEIANLRFLLCDFEYIPYGRVLVIDKSARNRTAFADLLMLHGLKTYTAADMDAAVKLIRAGEHFGLVFQDFATANSAALLRENGYDGVVIALAPEEIPKEVTVEGDFGGQIRKPAELRVVESVLNQFIVSRQPPAVIAAANYSRKKTERKTVSTAANIPAPAPQPASAEPTFEETLAAVENLGDVGADIIRPQVTPAPQPEPEAVPPAAVSSASEILSRDLPAGAAPPELTPPPEPTPTPPAEPEIKKTPVTKAEFIVLADDIFIKLYETMGGDLRAFAEHAKVIKNACADIGNSDLTAKARALEFAAKDGKTAYIAEFTPEFLSALRVFSDSLSPAPVNDAYVSSAVKTLTPAQTVGADIIRPQPTPEPKPESVRAASRRSADNNAPAGAAPPPEKKDELRADNIRPYTEKSAPNLLNTVVSACGDFDTPRALEAVNSIDTDTLNAVAYGLIEEIKSLIAVGELADAADLASNLLEDFE
jgi:CheY-like chemotaxis protein